MTVFYLTATAGSVTLTNGGALAANAFGGSTDFRDTANAGTASLINKGGVTNFADGGFLGFNGDSRAGQSTILNEGGAVAGAFGGITFFFDNSSADQATLHGLASVGSGVGARFFFSNLSDGGTARVILEGSGAEAAEMHVNVSDAGMAIGSIEGTGTVTLGGKNLAVGTNNQSTEFAGLIRNTIGAPLPGSLTKVGTGTLTLLGDSTYTGGTTISFGQLRVGNPNGFGLGTGPVVAQASASPRDVRLRFFGAANAGAVSITNEGEAAGKFEALTLFQNNASAGTAQITNLATQRANAFGGETEFGSSASAGNATISNRGSGFSSFFVGGGGVTEFFSTSTAGAATITNHGGAVASSYGGNTSFLGSASAGTATFINLPAVVANAAAGRTTFQITSTAADAVIENRGGILTNARGGATQFDSSAAPGVTAGRARITNQGGRAGGVTNGVTLFSGTASAGESTIFNEAGAANGATGGLATFQSTTPGQIATAGVATITNGGAALVNVGGGETKFLAGSSADDATFTNRGATVGGGIGGGVVFSGDATAGRVTIRNEGGAVNGAGSGSTSFSDFSTAGAATLYADSALGTAAGGAIIFLGTSDGGTARAVVAGGPGLSPGGLDLSLLSDAGMSIGSIEGGGIVSLGRRNLAVGGNDLSTTFSGLIRDGGFVNETGGSLNVVGSGALTLSGANTYTGPTAIGNGVTANSGKLIAGNISGSATGTGTVFVNNGGTLSGSGFIAGPVILRPGGTIAPGDPVTLTLENDLLWDGDSTIRLALGRDQAGSDLLQINGALTRGAGGVFRFELVDFGAVVGQSYELIHFNSLQGFTPSDFSFSGVEGNFTVTADAVGVFVTGVPEPGAALLLVVGLTGILARRPRLPFRQSEGEARRDLPRCDTQRIPRIRFEPPPWQC